MNYILIYPDEMRAESVGCYGGDAITPHIDALAAEGTRFDAAYTAHPVCTASRNALVTGCYPHVHGFRSLKHFLSARDHTFVRELRDAGFDTCFTGKSDCWDEEGTKDAFSSLGPALDSRFYDLHLLKTLYEQLESDPPQKPQPYDYTMLRPIMPDSAEASAADSLRTDWACQAIARHANSEQPFFLMLSLNNPHPAYEAFEKYRALYPAEGISPPRGPDWLADKPAFYRATRRYRELEGCDEAVFREIYATYLAMISYVDALVGQIVETLKATGQYENTAIIFCSDHGDFAGDAGLVEKWPSGGDEMLTRVPLLMRVPGCPAGHTVAEPVQSIDIFPTIFDFANIPIGHPQFGVSLRAQVEGAAGDPERAVYCEGGYDASEMHCFEGTPLFCMHNYPGSDYYPKMRQQQQAPETVCRMVMQRDRRYKLILRTNGENELYDLQVDPLEYRNLYDDPALTQTQLTLERRLTRWLIHTSDVTPYEGHFLPED